jgi:hypothetical protein
MPMQRKGYQMDLEERIRKKGRQILDEMGRKQFYDPKVLILPSGTPIGALITFHDRQIYITASEMFEELMYAAIADEQLQRDGRPIHPDEFFDSLMYFLINHEFDHHYECPKNQELMHLILEGCHSFLEGRVRSEQELVEKVMAGHNYISDTILNTINSLSDPNKEKYKEGEAYFFLLNYYFIRATGERFLDKASTLIIDPQLYLCRVQPDLRRKVEKYFTPAIYLPAIKTFPQFHISPGGTFFDMERYRNKLMTVFTGDERYTTRLLDGTLPPEAESDLVHRLRDTSLWKQMSYDYMSIIWKFIKKAEEAYQNSFTRSPFQNQGQSKQGKQQGQGGQPQQSQQQNQGQPQPGEQEREGNGQGYTSNQQNKGCSEDKKEGQGSGELEKEDKEKQGRGSGEEKKKDDEKQGKEREKEKGGTGDDGKQEKKTRKKPVKNGKIGKEPDKAKDPDQDGDPDEHDMPYEIPEFYKEYIRKENDKFYPIIKRLFEEEPDETSPYALALPRMDFIYRKRAGRIRMTGEEEKEMEGLYDQMLATEEMPFEEFSSEDIDWSSTRVTKDHQGKRNILLYRKTTPLTLPFKGESDQGGLPDIAWVVDCSPSMYFDPEAGEGQYHIAVLTIYSQLNYLEQEGIAPLLNYHVMNFSHRTRSSGWCTHAEQMKFKHTLFDYGGMGTVLDPTEFSRLRRERHDNFIIFMLSDFDFNFQTNYQEILNEIDLMRATGGIGFFPFQIGPEGAFAGDLKKRGIPVQTVIRPEDFLYGSIKITRDLYAEGNT